MARRLGVAPSTVRETLKRFESSGLGTPLPDGMTDGELEAALYANRRSKRGHRRHAEPDWPAVHRELKRKHVTLLIVWDEYIAENPDGYSYSRYVAAKIMLLTIGKSQGNRRFPGSICNIISGGRGGLHGFQKRHQ